MAANVQAFVLLGVRIP